MNSDTTLESSLPQDDVDATAPAPITMSEVTGRDRLEFLPKLFGKNYLQGEALCFNYMETMCEYYAGGLWTFWSLSNGGGFMSPPGEGPHHMSWEGNGFSAPMSAQAAGIVVTLFALNRLTFVRQDDDRLISRYWQLREFAIQHPEQRLILGAID